MRHGHFYCRHTNVNVCKKYGGRVSCQSPVCVSSRCLLKPAYLLWVRCQGNRKLVTLTDSKLFRNVRERWIQEWSTLRSFEADLRKWPPDRRYAYLFLFTESFICCQVSGLHSISSSLGIWSLILTEHISLSWSADVAWWQQTVTQVNLTLAQNWVDRYFCGLFVLMALFGCRIQTNHMDDYERASTNWCIALQSS